MAESSLKIEKFLGTDNVSDLSRVQHRGSSAYLPELINVDIDDDFLLKRRTGYDNLLYSGTGIHSLWSNGLECLFVQDTNFRKLNKDFTSTVLVADIDPTDRMSYVEANNLIVFSNHAIIGYVYDGHSHPFSEPSRIHKLKMVGGQHLEYFNSRLYAANHNILYYSDATIISRMDARKSGIPFPGRISMVKAVADGLYVGTDSAVFFLGGQDPAGFNFRQILDVGVIPGTAWVEDGDDIGRDVLGKTVYFQTSIGPHKGYPGGRVSQLQKGLFKITGAEYGVSIMRTVSGFTQFLSICSLDPTSGGGSGNLQISNPRIDSL